MRTIKLRDVDGVEREIPADSSTIFGVSFAATLALRDEYDRRGGPANVTPESVREVFIRPPVPPPENTAGFHAQVTALAKALAEDHGIQVNSVTFNWMDTFGTRVGWLGTVKVFTESKG